MLDFLRLSASALEKNGIQFETEEETHVFIDLLREEMEVRVGEEIMKGRTEKEVALFESCKTDEEVENWLLYYCPNYRDIIHIISKRLEKELNQYKRNISGNISTSTTIHHSKSQPNIKIHSEKALHQDIEESLPSHETGENKEKSQEEIQRINNLYFRGLLSETERNQSIHALLNNTL